MSAGAWTVTHSRCGDDRTGIRRQRICSVSQVPSMPKEGFQSGAYGSRRPSLASLAEALRVYPSARSPPPHRQCPAWNWGKVSCSPSRVLNRVLCVQKDQQPNRKQRVLLPSLGKYHIAWGLEAGLGSTLNLASSFSENLNLGAHLLGHAH